MSNLREPLVVFSDDWGRHPSSCQHLVSRLLSNRRVIWVNTIGTRPPRLNRATFNRGIEKLRQWISPRRPQAAPAADGQTPNPLVLNPKMWPSFRSRFSRSLNRRLLARALRPIVEASEAPPVVVATVPLLADVVGCFPAARWVYYCVDDFSVWPGLDGATLRKMEAELVARVDVAIAASETLQSHLSALGKPAQLLTHGVDLDFWKPRPVSADPPWLADLSQFERPWVVYWGVVDRRLDVNFVRALSERLTSGTVLFVGPREDPDPALLKLPRIAMAPAMPFSELPLLASHAAAFIAPYADLPVTRAMQPLKLKEYMAAGKPAVIRKLPATTPWADAAEVVETADAFAAAVLERLATGTTELQRLARERLALESWEAKAKLFDRWISE